MSRIEINDLAVNDELTTDEQRDTLGGLYRISWRSPSLTLGGVDGESQDSKHKDEIQLESFSWGATQL